MRVLDDLKKQLNKIAVDSLEAGSIFSQPIFIDEKNMLVPMGVPLGQKEIDKIKEWHITEVFTEGELVNESKPEASRAESAGQDLQPEVQSGHAREIVPADRETVSYAALHNIIIQLNAIFVLIERRQFSMVRHGQQLNTIFAALTSAIRNDSNSAVSFVLNGSLAGYPLAKNAVKTAILSVLMFRELSDSKEFNRNLLIGALLHDVGMLRLPKTVTEKKGSLSDLEHELMCAHVVYGYQIVIQELRCNEDIGLIVLQHHERWDGQGYSQQLGNKRIDIGAKVIAVADAFNAMISEKSYREPMTGYEAMKNLLSDNSHHFDPVILSAFVKMIGIYPVGQEVMLNNGAIARVIETRQKAPLRPLVLITRNEDGTAANAGTQLDLLTQSTIFIVRAIHKQK
jgi:HD-GYP domain-containing protein (c-di-GMP phosphodiesterase class II)